ncbi:MAG: DUF4369 domain-containing protein [Bacteroidaceae bacterium]|nr:DUF4369 domain-containing protein [Bacteroidaceae bacterium]
MNILIYKKLAMLSMAAISLIVSSCGNSYDGPTFTIKGTIGNADGKMLYLSHIGIDGITPLDSAKLDKEGNYEFTQPQPESYDFYYLAMKGAVPVTVAIDSTETVTISGDAKNLTGTYTVEGSEETSKIKEIRELQAALEKQVNAMITSKSPAIIKTRNDIYALIAEFKRNIARQYIASNPGKASAYFALSLTMNGEPIFNPMANRADSKCFAAVATNMQNRFPHAKRTHNLYEIAEKGMKSTTPAKQKEIEVGEAEIKTTGLFDIKLPDEKGDSIALSSLGGKVVLLDFTIYEDAKISSRNILLRDLYRKYSDKGFEIYQISFDSREHFWQQSASNLPWICVRDGQGAASSNAMLYNVQNLPTFYLINKKNEIVLRDNQINDLEKEIKSLMQQ